MDLFLPNVGHAFYEMRCRPVPESVDHTNLAGLLTDFAKTNDFTDAELVASPIFRRFDNGLLHQTSLISIPQTELNKVLGDAIPAESFAAGRNETSGVSGNFNYQNENGTPNGWPKTDDNNNPVWEHSDIKNVAYFYVRQLFKKIVDETKRGR